MRLVYLTLVLLLTACTAAINFKTVHGLQLVKGQPYFTASGTAANIGPALGHRLAEAEATNKLADSLMAAVSESCGVTITASPVRLVDIEQLAEQTDRDSVTVVEGVPMTMWNRLIKIYVTAVRRRRPNGIGCRRNGA